MELVCAGTPLDASLQRQAQIPFNLDRLRDLRYFWIDGLFAAVSENFYPGFVALFALLKGRQTAKGGPIAAAALLPGAGLLGAVRDQPFSPSRPWPG